MFTTLLPPNSDHVGLEDYNCTICHSQLIAWECAERSQMNHHHMTSLGGNKDVNKYVVGHEPRYHQRHFLEAWMSVKDPDAGNDHMLIPEDYKCLARTLNNSFESRAHSTGNVSF